MELPDLQGAESQQVDDGGGEGPVPPKGYIATTPQQRAQWNGFIDYLGKQGDINLNDPQVPINFLNQYKQNNPDFPITPEMIPAIQYENSQLRSGDSFNNLNADQLKAARAGMSPNFLNTTNVYKSYYPQFKSGSQDFGTSIEDYAKFKSGQPIAATDPNPSNSSLSATPPMTGTIPKPNYDDPESRLQYAHNIVKQYGPLLQGRGDTFLKVNETPDTGVDNQTPRQFTEEAAKKVGIDPVLLYTSAMEEGMSGLWHDKNGEIDSTDDDKYPINGFVSFGLDNFSDAFPGLVKKGYLPKDFSTQFKKAVNTNEKQQKVNSANFVNAAAAMQAKAAMIRDAQDTTEQYASKNGIPLSDRAKQFFTLVNYNAGEGNMQKMLKEYYRNGFLKNDNFIDKRPSASWKGPWENVARRIKAADIIKKEALWQDQ